MCRNLKNNRSITKLLNEVSLQREVKSTVDCVPMHMQAEENVYNMHVTTA